MSNARTVLGEPLESCSESPLTGFTRSCLCAARWREAMEAGCAPRVALRSTNERALEVVALAGLKAHAIELP